MVRWAFEAYAAGDYSVCQILHEVTLRGLTSRPSPKRAARPLGRNTMYKLLTNPYYTGMVRYKDALYPGHHEPIIDTALFEKVQSSLKARAVNTTRYVTHTHHLEGMLCCGICGSRMLLDFATNPHGVTYAYFVCSGRMKKIGCTRRAVPVHLAEKLVADSYRALTISETTYQTVAERINEAFDRRSAGRSAELTDLTKTRARLEAESEKLIQAHFADAIDLSSLKRHQDRIRTALADIDRRLAEHDQHYAGARAFLHDSLRLLTDAHRMYVGSGDAARRLANQAFFTRFTITEDEQVRATLAEPFATISGVCDSDQQARDTVQTTENPDESSLVASSRMHPMG